MNPQCLSVKTTVRIGTSAEAVVWDAFYGLDEKEDAEEYKRLQESIGNKKERPWGDFSVEIIPLYAQPSQPSGQDDARRLVKDIRSADPDLHIDFDLGMQGVINLVHARDAAQRAQGKRDALAEIEAPSSDDAETVRARYAERIAEKDKIIDAMAKALEMTKRAEKFWSSRMERALAQDLVDSALALRAQGRVELEEVLEDKRRLTRDIDVALNGEDGAAKQASLGDILAQIPSIKERWKAQGRREAADVYCTMVCASTGGYINSHPVCALCEYRQAILGPDAKETP